jgi:hypothetical protein
MAQPDRKLSTWSRLYCILLQSCLASALVGWSAAAATAQPYGTWLSKPQIMFHLSNRTLGSAMARMRAQQYRVVFLDFRHVSPADQQRVAQTARQNYLMPITWIQSPQLRSLSVPQMINEGRYTDGIQVDDHFFTNYSQNFFYSLRSQYRKPIFCSIQPFQAAKVPRSGCNKLDVQCYSAKGFKKCVELADKLGAIPSLSTENTLSYRHNTGGRSYNVFLWPHSNEFISRSPARRIETNSSNIWRRRVYR